MTTYQVIVDGKAIGGASFDGEPQINLTFEMADGVYKVTSRAHDEHEDEPTIHAVRV